MQSRMLTESRFSLQKGNGKKLERKVVRHKSCPALLYVNLSLMIVCSMSECFVVCNGLGVSGMLLENLSLDKAGTWYSISPIHNL